MNKNRRSLLVAVGLITLIAGVAIGLWRIKPNTVSTPADWVFELSFPDPKGQTTPLRSTRGEKLTLVNFWATWCPPCIEEMPELSRFHSEMSSKGIKVVGLAVDSPSNVREFLQNKTFSYPLLITGGAGTELAKKMGNAVDALPYTVLIDEKNRIIKQKAGRIREEELKSWISETR
ncbi:TlpA disulfide reductase family protein [beta proteobacterium MWH-UniP1]